MKRLLQEARVKKNEDNFLVETQKRIIKAYLPAIIMTRLDEATITSATDIISMIKKRYNIQISPGTVYPILYQNQLVRNGRIKKLLQPNKENLFSNREGQRNY